MGPPAAVARLSPAATSDFSVDGGDGEVIGAVCLRGSRSLSSWKQP